MIQWISSGLSWFFDLIVTYSNSYGIAIILLTILIRLLLLPLTIKQTKSLAAMKEIQPQLEEIQKKYKDNPQEMQARSMELYQEYKVNPLGGCFPMLVQLPILWAFIYVLRDLPESGAAQFLLWDLTVKDTTFILPILAMVTQYFNVKQTSADASQNSMALIMPIMIGVFSINLPSGLVLYWVVGNIFSAVQQAWIAKKYPVSSQGGQNK
ncbi:MAG: YidC/Oxa1 family membrane protein insertase [Firmicutes bacterium]|nr:YidC/Oxa1 family membrane protein insertase [Bacillota bacterium]